MDRMGLAKSISSMIWPLLHNHHNKLALIDPQRVYRILEAIGFSYSLMDHDNDDVDRSSSKLAKSSLISGFMVLFLRSGLTSAFNRLIIDTQLPCFENEWTELSIQNDLIVLVGMKSSLIKKMIKVMIDKDAPKNSLESHI